MDGLDKLAKGNVPLIVKTFFGLEQVLANELKQLGGANVKLLNRAVEVEGDLGFIYKANYNLRTALKILVPIFQFKASDKDMLYKKAKAFAWQNLFSVDQTFSIDFTVYSEHFTHSQYAAQVLKDAIVDKFRDEYGKRPSVDKEKPDIVINLFIGGNQVYISLDSTGEPLHKRGYRQHGDRAPISELLAAGMLMLSGWDKKSSLYDPMCGSGTLLIEGVFYACNIPPALHRPDFAFMRWRNFDADLWSKIKDNSLKKITDTETVFYGSDISYTALEAARKNIERADVQEYIKIRKTNFFDREAPPIKGLLITNPPYGERIGPQDINSFYKAIGDKLKTEYTGWKAGIIAEDAAALKHIGLKTSSKHNLFNGPIECKFQTYEMYKGTRKSK